MDRIEAYMMNSRRELLYVGGSGLVCGLVAVLSQSARVILSNGRYWPYRYSDVGGPFVGAIDMMFAFGSGAILGAGFGFRRANRDHPGAAWPWYFTVFPALILLYLVFAANFSEVKP